MDTTSYTVDYYINKAEDVQSRWFDFFSNKNKEAAEYYEHAANVAIINKDPRAAECFMKAADLHIMENNSHSAIQLYEKAYPQWIKRDTSKAIECGHKCIQAYLRSGRHSPAANMYQKLGELHEQNVEYHKAIESYEQAAELYEADGHYKSGIIKCLTKVGELCIALESYERAIEIYESIGEERSRQFTYAGNNMLLYAGLCYIVQEDLVGASRAIDKYININHTFSNNKEGKLLCEVLKAVSEKNPTMFSDACQIFNNLDPIHITLLTRIKNILGDDLAEDLS